MKIFLDVGSNNGQTLSYIMEPTHRFDRLFCKYDFKRIYCFEPVPELYTALASKFADPRITILNAGLWKEACEKPIYSPGTQSGSIFVDKINVDPAHSTICKFVRASDWFRDHVAETDEVYVKLNCEGSEVDIIEDLLDSDEYRKITSLGVSFDVRKIPSQRHREQEIKTRLEDGGYNQWVDLESVYKGSRRDALRKWLALAGADRCSFTHRMRHAVYYSRTFLPRLMRYSKRRLSHFRLPTAN